MKRDAWNDDSCQQQQDIDAEFDCLLRWSLNEWVQNAEPPDRVWLQIRAGLDGGPVAYPEKRRRASRLLTIIPAVGTVAMFLALISAILNINLSMARQSQTGDSWRTLNSGTPVVMSQEDALSGRLTFHHQRELRYVQRSLNPTTDPLLVYRHWN